MGLQLNFHDTILYFIIILLLFVYYFYLFSVKTFNYWRVRNVKFPKPKPLFGNSFDTIFRYKSLPENQQHLYSLFPEEKYIGIFMFRIPVLMIRDHHIINRILTKDFAYFHDRGIVADERIDLLSLHLVNLKGERWKVLRNKLLPVFSSGKLRNMCSKLEDCSNCLLEHFKNSVGDEGTEKELNFQEIISKYATDVIGSCAFGLETKSLKDPDSMFYKMGQSVFKPSLRIIMKFITRAIHPDLPYFLNLKLLHHDVENFFFNFVKDIIHQREDKNNSEKQNFIEILMDLRKLEQLPEDSKCKLVELDDHAVASNAFAFFLGGFETISSTLCFFLIEMAANQDIQDAIRKEILQANLDGQLSYDDIKKLPYMEMALSESLRKYPIGTVLLRECTETYQIPGHPLVIEKGTRIQIPVYSLHHDSNYFPEPEVFNPERFAPENINKIIPGTYLPFGEGPRKCIGLRFAMMEMKYALCKIMPKYKFTFSEKSVFPVRFKKGVPLLTNQDKCYLNITPIM